MWWSLVVACSDPVVGTQFHADVAPILDQHCMGCHTGDGLAPMSFDTYADTRPWAEAIVAATQSRTMPPKQVVQDGSCGAFADPWWLSDDELATLASWVEAGAPEGEPAVRRGPPALPSITTTHHVDTPEFTPQIDGGPGAEFDEYRCFPLALDGLTGDRFLTGYDVHPGNTAIVHHVTGLIVDPDRPSFRFGRNNRQQMAALDAESPDRLGWPCFNAAGPLVNYSAHPITWAPGQGAVPYPEGTGIRVPEGAVLVVQVHYNLVDPANVGQADSSRIELELEAEVEKEIFPLYVDFLLQSGDAIPAGEAGYVYTNTVRASALGVRDDREVIGVMPHMHTRGVSLDLAVDRGSDDAGSCLIDVPDWDYGWQFLYFYEQPVRLAPDDLVTLACTYDTRDVTEPVAAGWGAQNEMCSAVIYTTR